MKSTLKVRILGIDYYTMKMVSINKTIECKGLNFIDILVPPMEINNGKYQLPETIITAKQQADEWISNQSDFLNSIIYNPEHELNCIMNWEILSIENIGLDNLKSVALAPIPKKVKISEIEKPKDLSLDENNDSNVFIKNKYSNKLFSGNNVNNLFKKIEAKRKARPPAGGNAQINIQTFRTQIQWLLFYRRTFQLFQ